jgi:bifunctional DNase/RNase
VRVNETHYCAKHAEEALDVVNRECASERDAVLEEVDCCEVYVELVICDGRDGHSCGILLHEVGGHRRLPFATGRSEAWALSWELRHEPAPTLGTHHALLGAIRALGGDLKKITINDVSEGDIYHARAHVLQGPSWVVIDMRPSDAIILAVVGNAPAYVEGLVWQKTSG